jgi:pimeloyl-ACP methyl ester carboxylesterase
VAAVIAAGALAATALLNRHLAKKAERDNPPAGQFLEVDGVRLHYVERGSGEPLVLLHGNGSMIEDFVSSGLVDLAAKDYRVIIIDRPGFGHSSRPRNVTWTPDIQAQLIRHALDLLGVSQAIVLGHSLGRIRRGGYRTQVPRHGARPGSRLGLLLSNPASGRRCHVGSGRPSRG